MKKNRNQRLRLASEIVRALRVVDLAAVAGGGGSGTCKMDGCHTPTCPDPN